MGVFEAPTEEEALRDARFATHTDRRPEWPKVLASFTNQRAADRKWAMRTQELGYPVPNIL